jgi:hypothetical protein
MLKTLFARKTGRFPAENFVLAQGEREGYPAVAMINKAYKRYAFGAEFPWHVQIEIGMFDVSDALLPTSFEAAVLNAMEDRMEAQMKTVCTTHYIARQTWNRVRLLDYYVEDGPAIEAVLLAMQQGSPERTFTFTIERDESWSLCAGFFRRV